MNTARPTFLLIDDDDTFRLRLTKALRKRDFTVFETSTVDAGLDTCRTQPIDRAVIDLRMPGKDGLQFLKEIQEVTPTLEILLLTGYGSIATAVEAMRLGATNYLVKPADCDQILAAFEADSPETAPPPPIPSLARMEWEHINRVLAECGGNISQTARLLGLHRRSLQRKLAKYPPI